MYHQQNYTIDCFIIISSHRCSMFGHRCLIFQATECHIHVRPQIAIFRATDALCSATGASFSATDATDAIFQVRAADAQANIQSKDIIFPSCRLVAFLACDGFIPQGFPTRRFWRTQIVSAQWPFSLQGCATARRGVLGGDPCASYQHARSDDNQMTLCINCTVMWNRDMIRNSLPFYHHHSSVVQFAH